MATQEHMLHSFNTPPGKKTRSPYIFLMGVLGGGLILGVLSGYLLARSSSGTIGFNTNSTSLRDRSPASAKSAGLNDQKTFPDKADGVLKEGGIEGEGSFHLERPGGASQNVYLTSTTVDLSVFVGKKVKVLGKTYEAQHAGWLMDVGYIEIN